MIEDPSGLLQRGRGKMQVRAREWTASNGREEALEVG